ncbi:MULTISPECIES: serine hydrolase [Halomonadaceae]|uniref:serine hydrolase domain-containing protein n=1 Tax=Halomonadaceae TaxID=28256 RepID=UPI001598D29E|nr:MULTISPECIES: serine hydrolase [Halomonas]QJQ96828.1 serine hydrolase [Halomonas sp. PA5]
MSPDLTPPASPTTDWPHPHWETLRDSEAAGWSRPELDAALAYVDTIATDALLVIQHGRIVAAYGDLERRFMCHSIRKSLLSALFGFEVEREPHTLAYTLAELGIDDTQGLSEVEKQATVFDLLTARSGIYHPAGYETAWMQSIKPPRHSQAPDTKWCYSNWDFNALGTIYTQLSGLGIHAAFESLLARPLGMEDFRFDETRQDGHLEPDDCSRHPAYPFRLSTRDLARFGLLFLQGGRWQARQLLPAHWVATSLLPYSHAGTRGAYGYMWWLSRDGVAFPGASVPPATFSAQGAGGHYCLVLPALDLIVVHRVDTEQPNRQVDRFQFGHLLRLLLAACPKRR